MQKNPIENLGIDYAPGSKWLGCKEILGSADQWFKRTSSVIRTRGNGYHLCLTGPCDSGKTFLCGTLLERAADAGFSISYKRMPVFLDSIFAYYRGEDTGLLKDTILKPNFLVLEDVGSEPPSGFPHTQKFLHLALKERKFGTIITSRSSIGEIKDKYSPDLYSEIKGSCVMVSCPVIRAVVDTREDRKSKWLEGK